KLRTIQLSVGKDGRNRTVLWPFSSKTSRTQPKAKHWIFSPAVWLRFLIKPEPEKALAYLDFSSMEFGGAAALSDGHTGPSNPMLDLYRSGDPYLNFGNRFLFVEFGLQCNNIVFWFVRHGMLLSHDDRFDLACCGTVHRHRSRCPC